MEIEFPCKSLQNSAVELYPKPFQIFVPYFPYIYTQYSFVVPGYIPLSLHPSPVSVIIQVKQIKLPYD
jgi:hypothetical protein